MRNKFGIKKKGYLLLFCLLLCGITSFAQSQVTPTPITNGRPGSPLKDTSKTNTSHWKDENVVISYRKLNSLRTYTPDTSLHTFHRQPYLQPWNRDLGNLGSPVNNLLFIPESRLGPSLGYHVFDVYRFNVDSLNFYNSTRPYSEFTYRLGSKLEQIAGIMHTQNIKPNWNIAFEYRKIFSPGFYKIQRVVNDNACLSTNYKSLNKHYSLFAAMVYNKEQNDENGGIVNYQNLSDDIYHDRRTINVAFQNDKYSSTRSPVTNALRDFTFLVQHDYTWGRTDTTYSEDSTQYTYRLKPQFSITHKLEVSTEKHTYQDLAPDSTRYASLFYRYFTDNGTGHWQDSVLNIQKWFWIDNKLLLNGFLGKENRQLQFSAGLGNRYDEFISGPISVPILDSLPKQLFGIERDRKHIISNYLEGEIKKEAMLPGAWEYGANAKFFLTGQYAGNFLFNAVFGKQIKKINGSFSTGFQQQLNSAPYSYTNYENAYAKIFFNFDKESVTMLYATLENDRLRLSGGVRNYVVNNYIYINETGVPAQYVNPFTLTQVWGRKIFKAGNFLLDNELVYQQMPQDAPINVPALMGRHQLSYERSMFKKALKIATGIEVRYNSSYHPAGYDAILNRFYYQRSSYASNTPEAAVFLNFKVKRFRAFIMGDNIQQLFAKNAVGNTLLYTGSPLLKFNDKGFINSPVYAAPDFIIRFGFSWPLVN